MRTAIKKWKRLTSREIFSNRYLRILEDTVMLPDHQRSKYYLTDRNKRCVNVMAIDARGRILLNKEFRYPVGRVVYSIVGGAIDPGEAPIQAARRELREETGYRARKVTLLGTYYANPARNNTLFYGYVATGLIAGVATPEPREFIETKWVSIATFEKMIANGELRDPYTMVMYLLWKIKSGQPSPKKV